MKKFSTILMALLLICAMLLTSCGSKPAEDQSQNQANTPVEDTNDQTAQQPDTDKEDVPAEDKTPTDEKTSAEEETPAGEEEAPAEEEGPKEKAVRELSAEQAAERERRAAMPVPEASDYVFDEENVILTFGAFADTHTRRKGAKDDFTNENFALALDFLLSYTDNGLDAICVSGDITDTGVFNQVKGFSTVANEKLGELKVPVLFATGNHDLFNFGVPGFMEQYLYDGAFDADIDKSETDPSCRHSVVNGVHFIQISADAYNVGDQNYTDASMEWLEKRLEIAAADAPDMPIFVSTHLPIYDTVFGSDNFSEVYPTLVWASNELKATLAKYPQVVLLTGHTHYPEHAESGIVQDDFTMVNVGTINYIVVDAYFANEGTAPTGSAEHPQSMLIEVDKNGAVRITRFDYALQAQIRDAWILPPSAHEDFLQVYTYGRGNETPVFSVKDAAVEATGDGTTRQLQLNFTAADNNVSQVYYYEVQIAPANSTEVKALRYVTDFYLALQAEDMATALSYNLGKVSIGTTYTITLTPYNVFYNAGESQTITVDLT